MSSLYDELCERLKKNPKLTQRGVARFDLSLLLFNERESVHELWRTANRYTQSPDSEALCELRAAVDKLRPIFGERGEVKTNR